MLTSNTLLEAGTLQNVSQTTAEAVAAESPFERPLRVVKLSCIRHVEATGELVIEPHFKIKGFQTHASLLDGKMKELSSITAEDFQHACQDIKWAADRLGEKGLAVALREYLRGDRGSDASTRAHRAYAVVACAMNGLLLGDGLLKLLSPGQQLPEFELQI